MLNSAAILSARDLDRGWQAAEFPDGPHADGRPPDTCGADWFDVVVPGALQYDLVREGRLSNPFAGSTAVRNASWVHDRDWLFVNRFGFEARPGENETVFLEADGIDTFSDVWLNRTHIGTTANAYRGYRFEVPQDLLDADGNELIVHVKAHKRMVEHLVPEARKRMGPVFTYKGLIRRYQRSFLSNSSLLNLGGEVLGIGIYKPMRLIVTPDMRIDDVHFKVTSVAGSPATADVDITLSAMPPAGARVAAHLVDPDADEIVADVSRPMNTQTATLSLSVDAPKLWWPRGYGTPHRYRLRVELHAADGGITAHEAMVGLRTSRIERRCKNGRSTFRLYVNGEPIHCRGHNLVPVDYLKVHDTWDAYDRLLALTTDSNANMLRMWGGGAIESQDFFDACDARGIMIWQDLYLHSTTYPDWDEDWVSEFRTECEELLIALRNRPSLCIVCGGNEQYEGWDEWGWRGQIDRLYGERLFTEVGREVAETLTPELPYVVNSPHGGRSCQTPDSGDVHNWGNFYNSTKDPLWVTETCWSQQSYSRPETLEAVMGLDLEEYTGVGWPERWKDLTGLGLVTRLPYSGGPLAMSSLRDYLKCLEIEQALADHHALSNLLLRGPSCNGLLYWPLNKGGPLFQFGCVDYSGYPLASYYVVKRLFADICLCIYRDIDDIRVVGVNRSAQGFEGELHLTHEHLDGTVANSRTEAVSVPARDRVRIADLDGFYAEISDRTSEVIRAELKSGAESFCEETLFFCPLMEFGNRPGPMEVDVSKVDDTTWDVEVGSASLVKLCYLDGNQKFLMSDNYVTLSPSHPRRIRVRLLERVTDAPATLWACAMDNDGRREVPLE